MWNHKPAVHFSLIQEVGADLLILIPDKKSSQMFVVAFIVWNYSPGSWKFLRVFYVFD